ncbi:MAG: hypothetical protein MK100_09765, partial [Phycisphaerales bacterium]|nr:hypothetical protein [Phycisphaerales bacterium]
SPETVEIFERTGLTVRQSRQSTWSLLAILAAVLLIVDVAVRRIVPDRQRQEVLARRAAATATEGLELLQRRLARSGQASTSQQQQPPQKQESPKDVGPSPEGTGGSKSTRHRLQDIRDAIQGDVDEDDMS